MKSAFPTAVLLTLLPLMALSQPKPSTNGVVSLQQKPSDLLAGVQRAICYSGFRHLQHPDRGNGAINPTDKQIQEDLQILAQHGFGLLRLYDSQENSEAVLRTIETQRLPLKVLLGAWLDGEAPNPGCPWLHQTMTDAEMKASRAKNSNEVARAIVLANRYRNIVVAVAVGNEALVDWTDHLVPVQSVIIYVHKVRASVRQPITVCENYNWWAHHGADLAKELDFISVHTYPEWENKDIDDALSYSITNLQNVQNALPAARLVITEAGWATVASEFGPRATEEKQKRYYNELFAWTAKMNITTFFFEAFDEDWKGDLNNPLGAEKHWGIFTIDRSAKPVIQHQ